MSKKLTLALIVAGAISAFAYWNFNNACNIYQRIKNEPQYSQLTHQTQSTEIKNELKIRKKDSRVRANEFYGGVSFAIALASASAAATGVYLLIKKSP